MEFYCKIKVLFSPSLSSVLPPICFLFPAPTPSWIFSLLRTAGRSSELPSPTWTLTRCSPTGPASTASGPRTRPAGGKYFLSVILYWAEKLMKGHLNLVQLQPRQNLTKKNVMIWTFLMRLRLQKLEWSILQAGDRLRIQIYWKRPNIWSSQGENFVLFSSLTSLFRPSQGSRQDLSPSQELPEQIIINDVITPPFPSRAPGVKSGPTPPEKRILQQKEFDKKLRAKRDIFSRGRSLSLSSFKLTSKFKKSSSEKSPKRTKYWDKERSEPAGEPRGELDLLGMEQLINMSDLEEERSTDKI